MTTSAWLWFCVQPHERSWTRTTWLNSSWISDSQKLEDNKCLLLSATQFWSNLLCSIPSQPYWIRIGILTSFQNMRSMVQEVYTPFGFYLLPFSLLLFSGESHNPSSSNKICRRGRTSIPKESWRNISQISMEETRNAIKGNSNIQILNQLLSHLTCTSE